MPFPHAYAFFTEHPDEAATILSAAAAFLGGTVVSVAGGAWWLANALAKGRVDLLQDQIHGFQQKEKWLQDDIKQLKQEISTLPINPSVEKQVQKVDAAAFDLQAAGEAVGEAVGRVENLLSSVWNGVGEMLSPGKR